MLFYVTIIVWTENFLTISVNCFFFVNLLFLPTLPNILTKKPSTNNIIGTQTRTRTQTVLAFRVLTYNTRILSCVVAAS